jgi:hypothetical protein
MGVEPCDQFRIEPLRRLRVWIVAVLRQQDVRDVMEANNQFVITQPRSKREPTGESARGIA